MFLCDAPVIILAQFGGLAITPRSLPALAFVLLYLGICGYFDHPQSTVEMVGRAPAVDAGHLSVLDV
jgi:hypothetical protein